MRLQKWYTERGATKGGRKLERESFIFYRSFYDSIKGLGDAEFAECMRFLCEYGLNGAEQTENVSGYCRQESGKGVKGHGRCEGADTGSEKYDGTVL